MTGIELRELPLDARMGHQVTLAARRRGAIVRPLGDVVVLMPPLSISEAELARLVEITGRRDRRRAAERATTGCVTQTVYPVPRYRDARAAIEFLERSFGFETLSVTEGEGDSVVHAELNVGAGLIMLSSAGGDDPFPAGPSTSTWPCRTPTPTTTAPRAPERADRDGADRPALRIARVRRPRSPRATSGASGPVGLRPDDIARAAGRAGRLRSG